MSSQVQYYGGDRFADNPETFSNNYRSSNQSFQQPHSSYNESRGSWSEQRFQPGQQNNSDYYRNEAPDRQRYSQPMPEENSYKWRQNTENSYNQRSSYNPQHQENSSYQEEYQSSYNQNSYEKYNMPYAEETLQQDNGNYNQPNEFRIVDRQFQDMQINESRNPQENYNSVYQHGSQNRVIYSEPSSRQPDYYQDNNRAPPRSNPQDYTSQVSELSSGSQEPRHENSSRWSKAYSEPARLDQIGKPEIIAKTINDGREVAVFGVIAQVSPPSNLPSQHDYHQRGDERPQHPVEDSGHHPPPQQFSSSRTHHLAPIIERPSPPRSPQNRQHGHPLENIQDRYPPFQQKPAQIQPPHNGGKYPPNGGYDFHRDEYTDSSGYGSTLTERSYDGAMQSRPGSYSQDSRRQTDGRRSPHGPAGWRQQQRSSYSERIQESDLSTTQPNQISNDRAYEQGPRIREQGIQWASQRPNQGQSYEKQNYQPHPNEVAEVDRGQKITGVRAVKELFEKPGSIIPLPPKSQSYGSNKYNNTRPVPPRPRNLPNSDWDSQQRDFQQTQHLSPRTTQSSMPGFEVPSPRQEYDYPSQPDRELQPGYNRRSNEPRNIAPQPQENYESGPSQDRYLLPQDQLPPPPQDQYPPPQNRHPPPLNRHPPPQDRHPPSQDRHLPPQDRYPPPQDRLPPPQDRLPPPQDRHPPPQDRHPPPQDRHLPPQDRYPPPQDRLPPPQDRLPPPLDRLPPPQDRHPPPQNRLPPPQDRHPPPQDRHPPSRNRRYDDSGYTHSDKPPLPHYDPPPQHSQSMQNLDNLRPERRPPGSRNSFSNAPLDAYSDREQTSPPSSLPPKPESTQQNLSQRSNAGRTQDQWRSSDQSAQRRPPHDYNPDNQQHRQRFENGAFRDEAPALSPGDDRNYVPEVVAQSYEKFADEPPNNRHPPSQNRSQQPRSSNEQHPSQTTSYNRRPPESHPQHKDPGRHNSPQSPDYVPSVVSKSYGMLDQTMMQKGQPSVDEEWPAPPTSISQPENRSSYASENYGQQMYTSSISGNDLAQSNQVRPGDDNRSSNQARQPPAGGDNTRPYPKVPRHPFDPDDEDDSSEGIDVDAPTPPPTFQKAPWSHDARTGSRDATPEDRGLASARGADVPRQPRPVPAGEKYQQNRRQPGDGLNDEQYPPSTHSTSQPKQSQPASVSRPIAPRKPERTSIKKSNKSIIQQRDNIAPVKDSDAQKPLNHDHAMEKARLVKVGRSSRKLQSRASSSNMADVSPEDSISDYEITVTSNDLKQERSSPIIVHQPQVTECKHTEKPTQSSSEPHRNKHPLSEGTQTDIRMPAKVDAKKESSKFVFKVPSEDVLKRETAHPLPDSKRTPTYEGFGNTPKQKGIGSALRDQFQSARENALRSAAKKQDRALKSVQAIARMTKRAPSPVKSPKETRVDRNTELVKKHARDNQDFYNQSKPKSSREAPVERNTSSKYGSSGSDRHDDRSDRVGDHRGRSRARSRDRGISPEHRGRSRSRERLQSPNRRGRSQSRDRLRSPERRGRSRSRDRVTSPERRGRSRSRDRVTSPERRVRSRSRDRVTSPERRVRSRSRDRMTSPERRGRSRSRDRGISPDRRVRDRSRERLLERDDRARRSDRPISPHARGRDVPRPHHRRGESPARHRSDEPEWVEQYRRNRTPEESSSRRRAWVNDPRWRQNNKEFDINEYERVVKRATSYNSDFEQPQRKQMLPSKLMAKGNPPPSRRPPPGNTDWMKDLKEHNRIAQRNRFGTTGKF